MAKRKAKTKVTKEDQYKAFRKANRDLMKGRTIKTGPHLTNKDRPRKKKVDDADIN